MVEKVVSWSRWLTVLVAIALGIFIWKTADVDISARDFFLTTTAIMHIENVPLRIEVADTDEERKKGLSGRRELEEGTGLLFVFDEAAQHSMWMKDMQFPIDIIWIGENMTIVDIHENVSPDTYPKTFRPAKPARYAVETNALFADMFGVSIGQKVRLPIKTASE